MCTDESKALGAKDYALRDLLEPVQLGQRLRPFSQMAAVKVLVG